MYSLNVIFVLLEEVEECMGAHDTVHDDVQCALVKMWANSDCHDCICHVMGFLGVKCDC